MNITVQVSIRMARDGEGFRATTNCGRFSGWGWNEKQAVEALKREINQNA